MAALGHHQPLSVSPGHWLVTARSSHSGETESIQSVMYLVAPMEIVRSSAQAAELRINLPPLLGISI
jgi:hypothetical protein